MATLAYYPGCSLKSSSKFYEASIEKIFARYGITLKEIEDWSCCGASAAHTVDERLGHALAARNLALAEREECDLFAPCSACYNRAKVTNEMIRSDSVLHAQMNRAIEPLADERRYRGEEHHRSAGRLCRSGSDRERQEV